VTFGRGPILSEVDFALKSAASLFRPPDRDRVIIYLLSTKKLILLIYYPRGSTRDPCSFRIKKRTRNRKFMSLAGAKGDSRWPHAGMY